MRELKVMLIHDDVGETSIADAIEIENTIWVVPNWLESPSEGWKTPQRMFLLNLLPFQKLAGEGQKADYLINEPMPRCLFDGGDTSKLHIRFQVRDAPIDIRIPIPKGVH